MAVVDKATFKAQKDVDYADNTNEDITASIQRATFEDVADSTAFLAADESVSGNWTFDEKASGVAGTAASHLIVKSQLDDALESVRSTGIKFGGELSASGTTNKVALTAGEAVIFDDTDPENPTTTNISWTARTAADIDNTGVINWYYFDDNTDTLKQTSVPPTRENRRTRIWLGHAFSDGVDNLGTVKDRDFVSQITPQLREVAEALGFVRLSGLAIAANASANLTIDRSSGSLFDFGSNGQDSPHSKDYTTDTIADFFRIDRDSTTGLFTTIDPANYDNAGTLTAVSPSNRFTIQDIMFFSNDTISIQYGQALYASEDLAIAAIASRSYVMNPNTTEGLRLAYLVVQGSETDLTNATFITTNKFGEIGGGTSAAPTGLLEAANNLSDVASLTTTQSNLAAQDWDFQGIDITNIGDVEAAAATFNDDVTINSVTDGRGLTIIRSSDAGIFLKETSGSLHEYVIKNSGGLLAFQKFTNGSFNQTPLIINTTGGATFSSTLTVEGHISYQVEIPTAKTANYTLVEADNGKILEMNGTFSFIFPDGALSDGWSVQLVNIGTGTVTLDRTTNTETVKSKVQTAGTSDSLLESQFGGCTVYCNGTSFTAIGDLT